MNLERTALNRKGIGHKISVLLKFLLLPIVMFFQCATLHVFGQSDSEKPINLQTLEERLEEISRLKADHPDSAIFLLNAVARQSILLSGIERFDFQARVLNELGNAYRFKGTYVRAMDFYELGIQFSTTHELSLRKAKLMNALGGLYQELEDLDKALFYCKSALDIYQKDFSERTKDLCMLYANVGNLWILKGNNTEAESYLLQARKLNDYINDDYLTSLIFSGLGLVEIRLKDYNKALRYFEIGIAAAKRIESKDTKLALLANIGNTYVQTKRYADAEQLLLPAYQEALEIKHKYLTKEILALLVALYAETRQFDKAYAYQKKYTDLKSELFNEDLNERIAALDVKLQNIEKEKEILELNKLNEAKNFEIKRNRYLLFSIAILSFLTLALVWFYAQRVKLKNEAKIYNMESQLFRLQMKPHFIFNVLSSIGGFMNQNNSTQAGVYLAKFARLIRNVLEQSNKELIALNKEIELLRYYLELQQLRFPNRFEFEIDTEEIFESEQLFIPPMLLQPLVENAIEHGFSTLKEPGKLILTFTQNEDTLSIEIMDNGVGIHQRKEPRLPSDFQHLKQESVSSKLIEEQMKFYQRQLKKAFQISFEDLSESGNSNFSSGTRVLLTLPLIHKHK